MKLNIPYSVHHTFEHTIAEAVRVQLLQDLEPERGVAEYLGALTQLLHDKGVLTNDEVLALVPSFKEMP